MTQKDMTQKDQTSVPNDYETLTRFATALNEMDILRELGAQGWELTSVGLGILNFRRNPEAGTRWEYLRNSGVLDESALQELNAQGWQYTASWMHHLFNYFKRPVTA